VKTTPVLHLRNTSRYIRKVRIVQSFEYDLIVPVSSDVPRAVGSNTTEFLKF
jgi:hypothetical protein